MGKMSSKQASQVKRRGHAREERFNRYFDPGCQEINYSGPTADCNIADQELLKILQQHDILKEGVVPTISLKGGNTIQIHLGNLPELTDQYSVQPGKHTIVHHGISFSDQKKQLLSPIFWRKYLKKGNILCYDYDDGNYIFFDMEDVISFIVKNTHWRYLPTGRIKGDLHGKQYFTYEYRTKKDSFVLGAHGAKKGRDFINLIEQNVPNLKIKKEQ